MTKDKIEKIASQAKDVFLSHNWGKDNEERDNHARVVEMAKYLESNGIKCWIDEKEMTGDINAAMENGINFSRTFIACITENYMRKIDGQGPNGEQDNCLKEFKYASTNKTSAKMLVVVMEKNCGQTSDWFGPLESTLGSSLYCSFTNDDDFEANMDRIVVELKKRLDFPIEQQVKTKSIKKTARVEASEDEEQEPDGDDDGQEEPDDVQVEPDDDQDEPEPEYGEEGDLVCENGHKLKEFSTPVEGFSCDICNESQAEEAIMYGCRICNFDVCVNCRQ